MAEVQRRVFLAGAAALGVIQVVPTFAAPMVDKIEYDGGELRVTPVAHASFILETPNGVFYVDPVGAAADYEKMPHANVILITHEHGDHFQLETLEALYDEDMRLVVSASVYDQLSDRLKGRAEAMKPGEIAEVFGVKLTAIPAYNLTEERLNFHPKDRGDNGYVLDLDGFRIYVSGDTEDIPEMRALEDIDLAFMCMNLPFTMTAEQAASAVAAFKPKMVYPYHWQGRDGGTQDPEAFAKLVGDASEVRIAKWYTED